MKIFIDTADIEEIKHAHSLGLVDGVTTNPTLMAKTGKSFAEMVEEIVGVVDGPISVETVKEDAEGMIEDARRLAKCHKNIVVKIPMTSEGLKAVKVLSHEGINTNVTLIFSANQALLAAKAGATYVSPFIGRLDDNGQDGIHLLEEIMEMFQNYEFPTEVISASIRNPIHVKDTALLGVHIATIPYKIILQLAKHPLTDVGIRNFMSDFAKIPKK